MRLRFIALLLLVLIGANRAQPDPLNSEKELRFTITNAWDGTPIPEEEYVNFSLTPITNSRDVKLVISSPFYDDPPPIAPPGTPYSGLWRYEVAEVYFLNDNDQYLQIQIAPLGQYNVILFNERRNWLPEVLTFEVSPTIQGSKWSAETTIPGAYFPPKVSKFSCSASHGWGPGRKFISLTPSEEGSRTPDFHNIKGFQPIALGDKLDEDVNSPSGVWRTALAKENKFIIDKTWNGESLQENETICITLRELIGSKDIAVWIKAPYYGNSFPHGEPGENYSKFEKYEVVKLFFLNDNDQYLQVLLSPDGQYRVLIHNGERNMVDASNHLQVVTFIDDRTWIGNTEIPGSYFPPKASKFSVSATHEYNHQRRELSLTPQPPTAKEPNSHNIQDFVALNIQDKLNENINSLSAVWKAALKQEFRFTITESWDGQEIPEAEKVNIAVKIGGDPKKVTIWLQSPLYNDPVAEIEGHEPWTRQAVEVYFVNDNDQYLQVVITPNQEEYNVMLYNGSRNYINAGYKLDLKTFISDANWVAVTNIPLDYLPPKVTKFNAAAQHGEGENQTFISLARSPVGAKEHDFHNIEEFIPITFMDGLVTQLSPIWESSLRREYTYTIEHTFDGKLLQDNEKVKIILKGHDDSMDVVVRIESPFYNDPAPNGKPGEPFFGIWDYEVVEVYFLNDKDQYLEVEIAPQGQHFVLLMNGQRNIIRRSLPLSVVTTIEGSRWFGEALIPGDYLPPAVTKFNAYAIHGIDVYRRYLALYPADGATSPDFHNLKFFERIHMTIVSPQFHNATELSAVWESAINSAPQ